MSANAFARGKAHIETMDAQTRRMSPPLLYDLTELQRHANRLYAFSAQRTLELAQALYERHKLISYPRTDSRHLSQDVARTLPKIVEGDRGRLRRTARARNRRAAARPALSWMTRRSAITTPSFRPACRPRSIARSGRTQDVRSDLPPPASAWHDEHIWSVTTIITLVRSSVEDRFHSSGTAVVQDGWKVLDVVTRKSKADNGEEGDEDRTCLPASRRASRNEIARTSSRSQEDAGAQAIHRSAPCSPRWRRPARRSTIKSSRRR